MGIIKGTNCPRLVADLLMFCYERFVDVSDNDTQADVI